MQEMGEKLLAQALRHIDPLSGAITPPIALSSVRARAADACAARCLARRAVSKRARSEAAAPASF